jgi:hypothetical protein
MKKFFTPNISSLGRWMRAALGLILLIGGLIAVGQLLWLGIALFISSAFVLFEAARGWCFLRACGIKTKL